MEDKRVRKTKKYLKDTLIMLLDKESFEQITVTQLCENADVSRITFYSHYADKYDLLEDIFQDMIKIGTEDYMKREAEHNKDNNIVTGFCNVMDCILDLFYGNYNFFKHTDPNSNPYLAFSFYNHVLDTVAHHTNKEAARHRLKYSTGQITGFLCYGLLGFINESRSETYDMKKVKQDSHKILVELLQSGILF